MTNESTGAADKILKQVIALSNTAHKFQGYPTTAQFLTASLSPMQEAENPEVFPAPERTVIYYLKRRVVLRGNGFHQVAYLDLFLSSPSSHSKASSKAGSARPGDTDSLSLWRKEKSVTWRIE